MSVPRHASLRSFFFHIVSDPQHYLTIWWMSVFSPTSFHQPFPCIIFCLHSYTIKLRNSQQLWVVSINASEYIWFSSIVQTPTCFSKTCWVHAFQIYISCIDKFNMNVFAGLRTLKAAIQITHAMHVLKVFYRCLKKKKTLTFKICKLSF